MTKIKWKYFFTTFLVFIFVSILAYFVIISCLEHPFPQYEQYNCSRYCSAILNGEATALQLGEDCEKGKTKIFHIQIPNPIDCSRIKQDLHFITSSMSQEEDNYPLAYIITIHKEFDMFVKLLRAIYRPQNLYCIHVDKRSPEDYQRKVKSLSDCFDNIFLASKMEHVVYGGFSRLQADINCMKDLVNSAVAWKEVINLCGQDFPIKTNREIIWYIRNKWGGRNITPGTQQPLHMKYRTEYSYKEEIKNGEAQIFRLNHRKTAPPLELTIYFGTAYYVLTRQFVQFVLEDARAIALLEWSRDTYSPDEHYWVTLNRLKDAPDSTPNVSWDGDVRAVVWAPHAGPTSDGCKGYYRNNICVYGLRDLKWVVRQPAMFANKFEQTTNPLTVACLEQWHRDRVLNETSETIPLHWHLDD
ncbi:beta-1,3-galactosyl-O-glycosyl-glycoprotein beta-1,6-N-acetylglucosaminyltransferase 7 [Leucoraja erinacea]|uniref:beta-1,3-galactosyl-O-glycosyl-glycoprotein beta-1,6-N-acetylglucosaminyltransferase 7 n=1 Tax=Leucoraja erinaceus TaxID=7782 RepID=UPI00245603E0|nr:beta-1,3-galactosyl-O-glycosyl-glycoprotein beta-1,6-N-acetylglucosaminyltransferase 7 [Leucoraja erinacea]XP_055508028.1 beta-1,3-galactosyl-O-glycosyl-glycoprotein beta-1,6-N-acetylglucosaminyltransferase 7 [Leucoraja erinacea]XP_055508029.1 beta-1,3-galactosyl-O-glycosyl-glycoprotein beta-1,6-N-acetylglucosaminyltransferase 7 [Leucoraja erinacea]XP_055508030.1 beta-1,3-galactosyl-O-glycosyl-glycoprotein beta-1,6-N-acetylglucosaminyltransferase 7 [Leucoraja erinacea]